MRTRIAWIATAAALVALAVVGGMTGSDAAAPTGATPAFAPVTTRTLVCPQINGVVSEVVANAAVADFAGALRPPSTSTGKVTATVIGGAKRTTTSLSVQPVAVVRSVPKHNETIAFHATGSVAASIAVDEHSLVTAGRNRGLYGVACAEPQTDWWFAGADGRVGYDDTLVLTDPSTTAASVELSLWGARGPVSNSQVDMVRVPAGGVTNVPIPKIAPDEATLTVHVHASSGSVTAALLDRRSAALNSHGGDYIPPTRPPARSAVVPGFTAGAGLRVLYLTDPGPVDAAVSLRLVTPSGSFVPAGDEQVVVHAGHTTMVKLDRAFAGATGAVTLTSTRPIITSGLTQALVPRQRPDLAWLAATAPVDASAGVATGRAPYKGACRLLLSAPSAAATVEIRTPTGNHTMIKVPAGRSVAVDITHVIEGTRAHPAAVSWPFLVTVTGSAPVYGVRELVSAGAHGPLVSSEPLVDLPAPLRLPIVRENPRLATR
jgi:hypothetical protein